MTDKLREAAEQALEALEQLQGGCTDHEDGTVEAITVWCPELIDALRDALAEQPAEQEPNWRHPKIQSLIRADARNRIVIDLIWRILEAPNAEFTSSDMEYWDAIHDAVQAAITAPQPAKSPGDAREASPKCSQHPKAPHGFDRNRSHTQGRYVCECEGWDAYEAGKEEGIRLAAQASEPSAGLADDARLDWCLWRIKDLEAKLAAQRAAPAQAMDRAAKFRLGDPVRKTKGSQWHGVVVGTYSTELTPEGYAVESSTEKGSVQIYPAAALEAVPARAVEPLTKP